MEHSSIYFILLWHDWLSTSKSGYLKIAFFTQIADQGMPEAYVTTMESLSSIPMFVVMILTPIIGGLIGAYLARGDI